MGTFGDVATIYALKWKRELPHFANDIASLGSLRKENTVVAAFVSSIGPSLAVITHDERPVEEFARQQGFDYVDQLKPDNTGLVYLK